jgi:CRP-like cAMP-binding protein
VQLLETALGAMSLFAQLRPDEVGRIARRFERRALPEGAAFDLDAAERPPKLFIVLSGLIEAIVEDPVGELHLRMRPGDRYGDAMVLTRKPHSVRLVPLLASEIAVLDGTGLDAILCEFPAVALDLVKELALELRKRNDQVRQVLELKVAGMPAARVQRSIAHLKRTLILHSGSVRRLDTSGLFRRFVADQGAEPPFWMIIGFGLGLAGSRITVHMILKYHLEKHLFALVAGSDPNPVHIHHFNYGLILVAVTGLVSLSPYGRRSLRALALFFGLGCALVFDEFALFWNLNPDYSQGLSLMSAAIAAVVLVQIAYFRRFWQAVFGRIARWLGGE